MTKEEIYKLLFSTETSRIERTVSIGDMDKFQEAICAFSNDMSNSRQNGYLIIGAKDNGELSGLKVDDNLFKKISGIRSDGNILPIPMMTCERYEMGNGDLLIVEVQPSFSTPVRYRGRTFIRIGPQAVCPLNLSLQLWLVQILRFPVLLVWIKLLIILQQCQCQIRMQCHQKQTFR